MQLLEHRRKQRRAAPPVAVDLTAYVKARGAAVRPHRLEIYDQLKDQTISNLEALHARAKALNLRGLRAHWTDVFAAVEALIDWEEQERGRRSLERRLKSAHIGRFKPACDFD